MKARLAALTAKFAALQMREKRVVAAATLFAVGMGGYSLWVEPAQLRAAELTKRIVRQQGEMQNLQAQATGLAAQVKDPDAPNKAALADIRGQLALVERKLHEYDSSLVPAGRMPQLLQALFARHRGLELVSLQTLPPAPLLAPAPAEARPEGKPAEGKAAAPAVKPAGILKHGLELKMAGGYLDLLAYVAELEQLPQKLLWGRMALAAEYPRSELTLTVYTLSLDPVWMVM